MKVSLIGTGKTGRNLLHLIPKNHITGIFDSKTPIDIEKINQSDVCIIFVPGSAMADLIPKLMESSTPMVIGSTGFEWKEEDKERLKREKKRWIHGHNFSLNTNSIIRKLLREIGNYQKLLEKMHFNIHEIHHINKQDAPSGTALKWKEWLGIPNIDMTYERIGDAIGTHQLLIKTPMEEIQITHKTLDRAIFTRGALWTAQKLQNNKNLPYGLILFETLVNLSIGDDNNS